MNRREAVDLNLKTYHGSPCRNCGDTEKYVSSYGCTKCTLSRNDNEYIKKYSKSDKAKTRTKKYMEQYAADGKIAVNQKKYMDSEKGKNRYKKYYSENKDVWLKSNLKQYNFTLEEYHELYSKQKGCCAICNISEAELSKRMHVDHDHATGKIRGLLCHHCNTGIGLFKENVLIMKKAMDYLNG